MSAAAGRILVVEDDLSILTGVSMNLRYEGYEVLQAQDGAQGLVLAVEQSPDLVILDIMLPKMNGYEVLSELRRRGQRVPVLLLSAKGMERDKVQGLDLGADDYVAKPFGVAELLARVKALLRRRYGEEGTVIRFGDVAVELEGKRVLRAGKALEVTAQEFRLLVHLLSQPGRIFSREELLSGAWGLEYEGTPRTVDTFIRQLRAKLEPDPEQPRYFMTARGLGYRFEGEALTK
jgi:two-component system alkaline phosphatase synthesis response regulator PhoP